MLKKEFSVLGLGLLVITFFSLMFIFNGSKFGITGHTVLSQDTGGDFDEGTYVNTFHNGTFVMLSANNLTGTYTSKIFDAGGIATWNNFSWISQLCYGCELPNNGVTETGDFLSFINMSENLLLLHLNENPGTVFADDSGNNNTVTCSGTRCPTQSTNAKFNTSLNFDGNNDRINIAETADLNYFGDSLTLEAWVYPDRFSNSNGDGFPTIIDKDYNSQFSMYFSNEGGGNGGITVDLWTGGDDSISSNSIYPDDNWYHIVFTYDGSQMKIYVNSVLDNTGSASGDIDVNTKDILIGSGWSGLSQNNYLFDGIIDEVAIYNRSLSQTEITQRYSRGILDLNISARTCDDDACSGESFTLLGDNSSQDLGLLDNQYFQYKFNFETENSSFSPELKNTTVNYDLANSAPTLTLVEPQDGASLGYNTSIALNYVVADSDNNLDTCWYDINGASPITLASCANTTFDIAEGSHTITVYANDTDGEQVNDSASFSIDVGAPTIVLNSPVDVYLNDGNVTFRYTPTDLDLDTCSLWGDFGGEFELNQTDFAPTSGSENTFDLFLGDATYLWNIACNDTQGNEATNGNLTFYVDTAAPSPTLTEPTGTKTSRTGISLEFNVVDASPVSCKYDVYRGASLEIDNTTVNCSIESTTFDVTVDADFILNFYVNDSAGNSGSTNSSFSVDTSSPPSGGGGGSSSGGGGGSSSGGGGSSKYNTYGQDPFEIDPVSAIISIGEEKSLQVSVKNTKLISLNNCKLVVAEQYSPYIEAEEIQSIAGGGIFDFSFLLKAIDEKVKDLEMNLECLDNVSQTIPLEIALLSRELDVSFEKISFSSEKELSIEYSVESPFTAKKELVFRLTDSNGNVIAEVPKEVNLVGEEVFRETVIIGLEEIEEGIIKVSISENGFAPIVEESIIYGGKNIGTGFTLFALNQNTASIGIIGIIFFVLLFLVLRRIWKLRKLKKKK